VGGWRGTGSRLGAGKRFESLGSGIFVDGLRCAPAPAKIKPAELVLDSGRKLPRGVLEMVGWAPRLSLPCAPLGANGRVPGRARSGLRLGIVPWARGGKKCQDSVGDLCGMGLAPGCTSACAHVSPGAGKGEDCGLGRNGSKSWRNGARGQEEGMAPDWIGGCTPPRKVRGKRKGVGAKVRLGRGGGGRRYNL
jgi:hypothetical protein